MLPWGLCPQQRGPRRPRGLCLARTCAVGDTGRNHPLLKPPPRSPQSHHHLLSRPPHKNCLLCEPSVVRTGSSRFQNDRNSPLHFTGVSGEAGLGRTRHVWTAAESQPAPWAPVLKVRGVALPLLLSLGARELRLPTARRVTWVSASCFHPARRHSAPGSQLRSLWPRHTCPRCHRKLPVSEHGATGGNRTRYYLSHVTWWQPPPRPETLLVTVTLCQTA